MRARSSPRPRSARAGRPCIVGGTGGGGQGVYALDVSDPVGLRRRQGDVGVHRQGRRDARQRDRPPGDPEVQDRRDDQQVLRGRRERRQQLRRRRPLQHDRQSGDLHPRPGQGRRRPRGCWVSTTTRSSCRSRRPRSPRVSPTSRPRAAWPTRRSCCSPATCRATCGSSTSRTSIPPTGRLPACRTTRTARRRSRCTSRRTARPICSRSRCRPILAYGPNRTLIVAIGTGKYLETSDNAGPFKAQSVYALLDDNSAHARFGFADERDRRTRPAADGHRQQRRHDHQQRVHLGAAARRRRHREALGLVLRHAELVDHRRAPDQRVHRVRRQGLFRHRDPAGRRVARSAAGAATRSTSSPAPDRT